MWVRAGVELASNGPVAQDIECVQGLSQPYVLVDPDEHAGPDPASVGEPRVRVIVDVADQLVSAQSGIPPPPQDHRRPIRVFGLHRRGSGFQYLLEVHALHSRAGGNRDNWDAHSRRNVADVRSWPLSAGHWRLSNSPIPAVGGLALPTRWRRSKFPLADVRRQLRRCGRNALASAGRACFVKECFIPGAVIDAVEHQAMQVDVQIGRRAKALDERDATTLPASAAFRLSPAGLHRKPVITHCTMRSTGVSNSEWVAKRIPSGIGNDSLTQAQGRPGCVSGRAGAVKRRRPAVRRVCMTNSRIRALPGTGFRTTGRQRWPCRRGPTSGSSSGT